MRESEVEMSSWIPVADRMPESGDADLLGYIWVTDGEHVWTVHCNSKYAQKGLFTKKVTHWKERHMCYEVKSGIKMPESVTKKRGPKYPFAEMKVGDSFYYPDEDKAKVAVAASGYKKKQGGKWDYVTAKWRKGYRVWRTA